MGSLYNREKLVKMTMLAILVAIVIVFQPELRRALEQIGNSTCNGAVGQSAHTIGNIGLQASHRVLTVWHSTGPQTVGDQHHSIRTEYGKGQTNASRMDMNAVAD